MASPAKLADAESGQSFRCRRASRPFNTSTNGIGKKGHRSELFIAFCSVRSIRSRRLSLAFPLLQFLLKTDMRDGTLGQPRGIPVHTEVWESIFELDRKVIDLPGTEGWFNTVGKIFFNSQ